MIVILPLVIVMLVDGICSIPELKLVQIVFRHGDRAPALIYPTDSNQADKWPNGIGQLTDEGIRQQYKLGLWLRKRYATYVGPTLYNSDIYVRSTDYDRTLMSAESNLAGFVYNDSKNIINGLHWQPIPVHTIHKKNDYLLQFNVCPRYTEKRKALYRLAYFKNKLAPYEPLLMHLQKMTGIKDLSFMATWEVFDTLFCEKTHNLTTDSWVTSEIWKEIVALKDLNWEMMFYKDLAKLSNGYLLWTIMHHMKQVSRNVKTNKKYPKIFMFSGHDTDLGPIANMLGFQNTSQPPYASCIIFEMYYNANETEKWTVKVLFKKGPESTDDSIVHVETIPGCGSEFCSFTDFLKVTKPNVMTKEQFINECGLKVNLLLYIVPVVIVVFVALIVIVVIWLCRYHRKNQARRYIEILNSSDDY